MYRLSKGNNSEICVLSRCIEYILIIYMLLHIKKHYFIHFFYLFLKPSKAFSVSLKLVVIRDQNIQRSNSLKWIARYFVSLVSVDINRFLNYFPVNIDLCKVKKRNGRKKCEICSKLTIKTQERRH